MTFVPIRNIQLEEEALKARLPAAAAPAPTAPADPRIASGGYAQGTSPATNGAPRRRSRDEDAPDPTALFFATPRTVTGRYDRGLNLANHLDFQFLPGRRYNRYWDPEGLLSTLPSIATCLLGVFAGLLLRSGADWRTKIRRLLAGAAAALAIGYLWGLQFPVVKQIWTSTFVLVAGGYSLLLLAAFYFIVDVRNHQRWCQPFIWIGMNAITVYLVANIVGFERLADRLAGGTVHDFLDTHVTEGFGDLVLALIALALAILFCRFLYRRGIFLRL